MADLTIEPIGDKRLRAILHNTSGRELYIRAYRFEPVTIPRKYFSILSQPEPADVRRRRERLKPGLELLLLPGDRIEREYDLNLLFNHPSGPTHMYVPVRHCNPDREWWVVSNVIDL